MGVKGGAHHGHEGVLGEHCTLRAEVLADAEREGHVIQRAAALAAQEEVKPHQAVRLGHFEARGVEEVFAWRLRELQTRGAR